MRVGRSLRLVAGLACAAVGLVLTARPFRSLSVLLWLVAAAAVATGVLQWLAARRSAGRLDDAVAAAWVALGVAVAAWPDLGLRGIAVLVGLGMVVAGVAHVVGGVRGTADERLASILQGAAGAVLGTVALSWPDITLLVVAVAFGIRTVLFGVAEVLVALRGERGHERRPRGRLRRFARTAGAGVALAFALAVGAVSAVLNDARPDVPAFYDPPEDVPAEPGRLVDAEPFDRGVPDGADGFRILYTTTRTDGVPAVASGIVVVPRGVDGPAPVISWAHGTTGVQRRCAPSILAGGLEAGAFFLVEHVVDQGWAVVATDYLGLGTQGPHPYLVGEPSGRAVLDATRAARELEGVDLAGETVVWGHSQGGGAALWAGQLAPSYAPDAGVLAVAALAPAADVAGLVDGLRELTGGSIFAAYVVTAYAATYDDVRLGDYVRRGAAESVRGLADRCLGEPAVLASVLSSITTGMRVFVDDLGSGGLLARLDENAPRGPFEVPLLVAQGADDAIVDAGVQAAFVDGLCAAAADVDLRVHPGLGHVPLVEADSPLVPELLAWTRARFDGAATTPTC